MALKLIKGCLVEAVQSAVSKKKDWKSYTIKSLAYCVVLPKIAGIAFGMTVPKTSIATIPGID